MRLLKSRWTLVMLLTIAGVGLWVRPAPAYTTSQCYGDTLYVDFYDDNGGYHGFFRQQHSPQCT